VLSRVHDRRVDMGDDTQKSSKEQLEEMLKSLLSKPGIKEKAASILGIGTKKGEKGTIVHTARNYVSVLVETECLTCGHKESRIKMLSKADSLTYLDKAGNAHIVYFRNVDETLEIHSHCTFCYHCRTFAKGLDRETLEERFLELAQISSLMWSAFRKEQRDNKDRKEPLDPAKYPQTRRCLGDYTIQDREEEESYGEIITEVKVEPLSAEQLADDTTDTPSDIDELPDWEVPPEEPDEGGDTTGEQDLSEGQLAWIDYLGPKRDDCVD